MVKTIYLFCAEPAFHPHIINNTKDRENYIFGKIKDGQAHGAFIGNELVGFITCDIFNFHGADSAICHFCGNAADLSNRVSIYMEMYKEVSKLWVEKGALNHFIVIATRDTELKDALFELGFGAYGPYGYASFEKALQYKSEYEITVAIREDIKALTEIVHESSDYYASSPLYLKSDFSTDDLAAKIDGGRILLAYDKDQIVGFMTTSLADTDNIYDMNTKGCLLIKDTFIKEKHRNKGIGSHFVSEISQFCIQNNMPYVHVSWESANLYANRFWRKYFAPTLLGMKRVLPPDAR